MTNPIERVDWDEDALRESGCILIQEIRPSVYEVWDFKRGNCFIALGMAAVVSYVTPPK